MPLFFSTFQLIPSDCHPYFYGNADPNLGELALSKALFYSGRVGKKLLSKRELEQVKETFVSIIPPVSLSSFGKRDLIIDPIQRKWAKSLYFTILLSTISTSLTFWENLPWFPQYWDITGFFSTFADCAFLHLFLDLFIVYVRKTLTGVKIWCWWFETFLDENWLIFHSLDASHRGLQFFRPRWGAVSSWREFKPVLQ